MTANELETKLNDLGISETMEVSYNKITKALYIYIFINFEKEIIRDHNPKLIKALEDNASFDLSCFDEIPLEKFPKFKIEVFNQNGVFSVIPDYIPISEIETYVFTSLEKLFEVILKDWGVI